MAVVDPVVVAEVVVANFFLQLQKCNSTIFAILEQEYVMLSHKRKQNNGLTLKHLKKKRDYDIYNLDN